MALETVLSPEGDPPGSAGSELVAAEGLCGGELRILGEVEPVEGAEGVGGPVVEGHQDVELWGLVYEVKGHATLRPAL